jgi:hypothetical protein
MTGGGNSVGHESLYNDSLGIYQLFTSLLRFIWVIKQSHFCLNDKVTTVHIHSIYCVCCYIYTVYTVYVWTSMTPN